MAKQSCCPTCGRAYRVTRVNVNPDQDTATMSDAEIKAYYAATAPIEDARAFLRQTLPDDLIDRVSALLDRLHAQGGKHSPATRREYASLHQGWREWRNRLEYERRARQTAA